MANMTQAYSDEDIANLFKWRFAGVTYAEIGNRLGRTEGSVRQQIFHRRIGTEVPKNIIKESPYPRYDNPLKMVAEKVLVISDLEIPFHHSPFVNEVLELAQVWGVKHLILNGDTLHFDSVSSWEPNWMESAKQGMGEEAEVELINLANKLPLKYGSQLRELLDKLDGSQSGDPNISEELSVARRTLRVFNDLFDEVIFNLGNHEGRFLRAMQSPMFPTELRSLLELGERWKFAPYYFCIAESGTESYRISHPKSASRITPTKLAAKFQMNVVAGHSHRWSMERDVSGKFWAISSGCGVDEARLPYCAQRDTNTEAHRLGAVFLINGCPFLVGEDTSWKLLKQIHP